MAAQNKLFQRLIWLADTVYSAKHITMEEIDSRATTKKRVLDRLSDWFERFFDIFKFE